MKRKKRLLAILLTVSLGAAPAVSYAAEFADSGTADENTIEEECVESCSEPEDMDSEANVVVSGEVDAKEAVSEEVEEVEAKEPFPEEVAEDDAKEEVPEEMDDVLAKEAYDEEEYGIQLLANGDTAFAVYSETDDSLIFYTDSTVPDAGSTYREKDVTAVYTGFDTAEYAAASEVPWRSVRGDVQSVRFDESFTDVQPNATALWFSEFTGCAEFDMANLDTSQVTTMYRMFYYCSHAAELDVRHFDTANVTSMQGMFNNCRAITELDVSGFDTSHVKTMEAMFYSCSNLITIYSDDSMFVTTGLTTEINMFTGCGVLVGGCGTVWNNSRITSAMAHVDTTDYPGYFTNRSFYDGVIFAPSNKTANRLAANGGGRTAMTGLSQFAGEYGKLEIILPTDSDLGSKFTIYRDETGTEYTSSAALGNITGDYNWKLVGWYNIANGEYYSVADGKEVTAEIDLHKNNVFYADYISTSYDFGSSTDGAFIDTVSTADFVDIQMFDYNELFNLYSCDLSAAMSENTEAAFNNSTFDETWTDGEKFYDTPNYNGLNRNGTTALTNSFIFLGGANGGGTILNPHNYASWNNSTTTIQSASNWGITSPSFSNPIIGSLFNPNSDRIGVTYVGQSDFLFQYGTDGKEGQNPNTEKYVGYYYYDSGLYSAAYNQSAQRFYVYDRLEYGSSGGTQLSMFLPYNYFTDETMHSDPQIDYWFGMSMEIQFYLPDDVGTAAAPSKNIVQDKNMVFNFSGDDDIMVFVDDALVLDMAGVHTRADGTIDFATGTVTRAVWNYEETGYAWGPQTTSFELGAGNHTMTVYYMERGRSASNLSVSFNIFPEWQYESDSVTTVTASKEWADGAELHAEDAVRMGLFEQVSEFEQSGDSFIIDGMTYTYQAGKTYTAEGKEYTYNAFYFSDSGGIAWYDEDANELYVLVSAPAGQRNPVDLSSGNGWEYVWELLDDDKEYIIREMTQSAAYGASYSVSADPEGYAYWSIIGETELEEAVSGAGDPSAVTLDVILTDAAQAAAEEGTLLGIVINHSLLPDSNIVFSMHAQKNTEDSSLFRYGIVNDSQITDDMVWTLTYTADLGSDVYGAKRLHTFTLSHERDGSRYFLALDESLSGLTVTTSLSAAAEFYCDNAGELRVYSSGGSLVSAKRVVISENGRLSIEDTVSDLQENNLHIYTLTTGHTTVYGWKVVNRSAFELPNTGGYGTLRFIVIGLAVLCGGAAGIYTRGKRQKRV